MNRILIDALVFAAVALTAFLLVSTFYKYSLEKLEKKRKREEYGISRFVTPLRLLTFKLAAAFGGGVALLLGLIAGGVFNPLIYLPCSLALGLVGYWVPDLYYRFKASRRRAAFESKLLDLTIGLAGGMRAGLALPQAFEAMARRMSDPMKEELMITLREYRLGLDFSSALERLHRRMPCEDLHLLVTTIRLTTKSGGSLVEVLEEMIGTIRNRTEFHEKLKNMTAQGRFEAIAMSLAPVAAFIVLYLIDPVLMGPMLTTGIGWCGIAVVLLLVTIGFFVINKIVTIEV